MTTGRAPNDTEAHAIAAALAQRFGATIVQKRDHWVFLGIAAGLDGLHRLLGTAAPKALTTGDQFLDAWCTTLPYPGGPLIGMCRIDDPGAWLDVACHELEHAVQITGKHGDDAARALDPYAMPAGLGYVLMYALGQAGDVKSFDEGRAKAEGQAEGTKVEVHHARTGTVPTADDAKVPFCTGEYLLNANGKGVLRGVLAARITSAEDGGRNSVVSKAFVALCRQSYPHLLATSP